MVELSDVVQFDKVVNALIGFHAFTVLAPQILVLQKMLDAVTPKGEPSGMCTPYYVSCCVHYAVSMQVVPKLCRQAVSIVLP